MLILEGEVTRTAAPPNKADQFRVVSIWISETEDEMELTLPLNEFLKYDFQEGDKLSIKIDKQFDIDSLARDLFKQGQ